MKAIIFIIAIALILGLGAIWLNANPQSVPAGPRPVVQEISSSPALPRATDSAAIASSTSAVRPLATHTVGTASATPTLIAVGTSTQVTVSIQITDPALITTSVNLLRLGATGTQPTILGTMQSAGNGTYTLQHVFNESTTGQIQLQVSAAFQGSLQRVLSNVCVVNVWLHFVDQTNGISLLVPQFAATVTVSSTAATSGSGGSLQINVLDPLDAHYVISPITFIIQSNPQHLSLQDWFEQNIDYQGLLLANGNIQSQTLSNGYLLFTLSGSFPEGYVNHVGGPIPIYYAMSNDGSRIITIVTPEDPAFADIGISPSGLNGMIPSVLSTVVTE